MKESKNTIETNTQSNLVNFADLKAKPILAKIGAIEIYNIRSKDNADRRLAMFEYIKKALVESGDKIDFQSAGKDLILNLLPILTNILLEGLDDEVIDGIIEEPSDELLETQRYITKIIESSLKDISDFQELPEEVRSSYMEQAEAKIAPKKSEKELKKEALLAELAELDTIEEGE